MPARSSAPDVVVAAAALSSWGTFVLTSLLYTLHSRRRRGRRKDDVVDDDDVRNRLPTTMRAAARGTARRLALMTKNEVRSLRSKHFCDRVSVSYSNSGPLMIVEGSGCRLIDSSGVSYLDTRNNVAHVGHANPRVVSAVSRQASKLNTNTRYLHPNVTLLASRLSSLLPGPLEVVFFTNSGSESNDLALRLARCYTKSKNTIVVDGAYHGHTLAALEVSPYKYEHSKEFDSVPQPGGSDVRTPGSHVWKVPAPDVYRGKHRNPLTASADYASYVEEACNHYVQTRKEKVGAFIIEGGMSVAGVVLPPPEYVKRCVDAVRKAGGVYIADEVQTGFGRFGTSYWAFQHRPEGEREGERASSSDDVAIPDIVTVGKPFGNGMPLSAVITTRKIANAFSDMGVEYFNTFGGNPVCAAAALAVLDEIDDMSLLQNATVVGSYLRQRFRELQHKIELVGDVRGAGLFVGIELVKDRATLEPATSETSFLCTTLKEKYRILTSVDGFHDNVLVVKPPMVFGVEDVDMFVESFEKAVTEDLAAAGDVSSMAKTPS